MIYIVAHKPVKYGLWNNGIYRPIQVGTNADFLDLRDNENEDNISNLNWLWAENTATYYIWKHRPDNDYKGQCQYRRRLKFESPEEIKTLLEEHGIIVPRPLRNPVKIQYELCHSKKDLRIAKAVINEKFPEYKEAFKDYIENGNLIFYSDSFVMTPEGYDKWAEFLFTFGEEFIRRSWGTAENAKERIFKEMKSGTRKSICPVGDKKERYQLRVLGFLTERLLTMWIRHWYKDPAIVDYVKMENTRI